MAVVGVEVGARRGGGIGEMEREKGGGGWIWIWWPILRLTERPGGGHEQQILSSHIPPRHRHMIIATTRGSLFCLAALQHKPDQCRMSP